MMYGVCTPQLVPLMILVAKFGICSSFNFVFLANSFLFPPIFVSTAFGICNFFAQITTILAPSVAEIQDPIPMFIFATLTLIGTIASFFVITNFPKFN
jgi:hypothetical protein